MRNRVSALLLALCILQGLASPALAAETAAAIRLSKTTGTVSVSKSSGKSLTLLSDMRLYNGYHVTTSAGSYAWMNLDDAKLIKEDASSEVEVRKSGKLLEVNISSGNVFFDVSEKLEDDESLKISTSTMIVGIRGTAGYVEVVDRWTTQLTVLEGEIQCSVSDPVTGQRKSEAVRGGETVQCVVYPQDQPGDKCDILREKTAVEDIPGYVLTDVVRDMELCDRIEADTGTDILEELAKIVGGDPSGRSEDGKSASPEILGEADRRERQDETDLREKQEQIDAEQKTQESKESDDKVFGQEKKEDDDTGDGDPSDTSNPSDTSQTTAPTSTTVTMPVTAADLQRLLNTYDTVNVQPDPAGAQNTLTLDQEVTVSAGTTLNLGDGIAMAVNSTFRVDGTANIDDVSNYNTIIVNSSNTLHIRGYLSNGNVLMVTAAGRVVLDGPYWISSAMPGELWLTEGAQVLSKEASWFGLPLHWAVSGHKATYNGEEYFQLVHIVSHTVTFDANGGTLAGSASTTAATGEGGMLAAGDIPEDPVWDGRTFSGWNTRADGSGTAIAADALSSHVFTADTTLYAHWSIGGDGWSYDADTKALTIASDNAMDYSLDGGDAPWAAYKADIRTVTIQNGVTYIQQIAFQDCTSLTSVTIPTGVENIYGYAFRSCTALKSVTIPASMRSISEFAFLDSGLTDITFQGTKEQWEAVGKTDAIPDGVTVHCTDGDYGTYTVTFNPNNGYFGSSEDAVSVTTNSSGKLDPNKIPEDPILVNWTFTGWSTSESGGTTIDPTNYTFTADTTLYAQWKELYRIVFNLNGGKWEGAPSTEPPYEYITDENGRLTEEIPTPVYDGSIFEGWYIAVEGEDGQPTQQKIDPNQYQFTKHTAVDAVWTENILDLKLSDYEIMTAVQTAIQEALNGSTYTQVNVSLGTSAADAFYIQDSLTVPAGKELDLNCPFTLGSADGSTQGTLTVNGTLALNGSQTGTVYSGSKISVAGTGTFKVSGKVTVNSGGAVENAGTFNTGYSYENSLIIEAGGTFTNTGKLRLGYFNAFTNNGTFTNAAGGVLDGGSGSGTNKGTFINSGTIDSSATITNASGGTLTNNGTIESSSFFNNTGGTLINNGTLINKETGYFYNDGTLTNNGTITNNGTYYGDAITGGTVDGANAGQVTGGNQKPEEGTP